ncbi:unnamed protein product [Musa acuminata subsp. burmannicoides]
MDLDPAALTISDVSVPPSSLSLLRISLKNNNMITSKNALVGSSHLLSCSQLIITPTSPTASDINNSFAVLNNSSILQRSHNRVQRSNTSSKLDLTPQSETIPFQVSLQVFFEWSTAVRSLSLSLAWWSTAAPSAGLEGLLYHHTFMPCFCWWQCKQEDSPSVLAQRVASFLPFRGLSSFV